MKNLKITITAVMALFLFQSCSEDKMDEINADKNNPTNIPSRLIITDVMSASAFTITGSDYSFYAGIYAELNAGKHNQMFNAQIRKGEPTAESTYNNPWNASYRQLKTLQTIIAKCSEGGSEVGNYQTLGVAQILYAYNLAILTDLFGDVPYSEASKPSEFLQPKLDKQEDIYNSVFALLKDAIVNLDKATPYKLGNQDIIYASNSAKWKKAANGLLARYTMRLSLRKADYAAVISYVDASFSNVSEEFKLVHPNVPNPYALFKRDRDGLGVAKSFYDILKANGNADIRNQEFFTKIDGSVATFDNSLVFPVEGQTIYSNSALMNDKNPIYLMSYHELLFLKAEAQARLGLATAQATMNSAIKAAYTKAQEKTFTTQQADTYIASIGTLTGNALLKKIMVEKYISFYENEGIEAFNDIRRLKAMGNGDLIPMVNPQTEKFPNRFGYGQSDVSANLKVKEAFGDGSYVYTEKVWWAGGTR
ncbi:SusD/RagB family nutrient-binding outer membrane lipoprotein [Flavobacterium weaverense]|uniref:SusD-like starch-binding protein associating with outer membrane n=1 Tax=Flavobacterium weaverense TaxID=271156 RepID=A0A3L9ZRB7_9FLAO|nr:SusD/RagB family nutrient-binding outer membrane lipoprotein [Flavobacterium weaverense]RMA74870.1 SusD-like starch-binding protein associating with outer membrane [Flavobacterium weaverense]